MSPFKRSAPRRLRPILLAAASIFTPALVHAQTDGTWATDVGTAGGNWSDPANWVGGAIAGDGGTATFVTLPTFTTAPINIVQDQPTVTLSGIEFDAFITYLVRPAVVGSNTLTLTGGATVHTPRPSINTIAVTFFGHQLQIPITGSSGLTKTGPGTVTLWQANTYTGDTTINGGIVVARQFGDAVFGNPAGQIHLNDGSIRVTTAGWTTSRTINLSGDATFESGTSQNITFNGPVIGSGNLNKIGSNGLIMTAANNYSGATNLLAGTMSLNGNGALASTSSLTLRNTMTLDNSATNLTNRVNDTAPVTFLGSAMALTGNASAASSETIGATTLSRGTTTITVAPGVGQSASLATGPVQRDTGAAAFFRGTNLGAAPGANTANITFASTPALVGGGGAAGTTNISIIPWAFGNTNSTATATDLNNSFVTYGPNGIRPLNISTEYTSTMFNAMSPTDNVRLGAADSVASPKTINSLIITGSGLITGAGPLTITSGAILNPSPAILQCPLDFGSAEAMLLAPANITLSSTISGSGGLTKQGAGIATFSNAGSTYTGTTTIGGGTAVLTASVPAGGPGPFGSDTSAIVLAPAGLGTGGSTARLVYGGAGAATFDRDLRVSGRIAVNNAATIPGFGVNTASQLTMNGDITLDGSPMTFMGPAGSTVTVNGDISGAGGPITDQAAAGANIVLNGNNTFTGGAEMTSGIWHVGSDTAFGTGMLKMVVAANPTIMASGGPRIVPNEPVSFGLTFNYWTIAGSNPITFTGSINLSGSYTHNINNSALTTYAGVVHTGGFTKAGPGTLVLSGDNIYTGATTVSAGALRVAHSNALGTPQSPTTVSNGASLEITGNSLSAEPVTISGFGLTSSGAIRNLNGNNTLGPISLPTSSNIAVVTGSLRIGNVSSTITSATLFKEGPGALSAERYRLRSVEVVAGTAAVTPGRSTDKTSLMEILLVEGGQFDLGNNDLVLDYDLSNPFMMTRNQIQSAYNNGAWNGIGLTSTLADASNFALGYAESSSIFTTFPAIFSGLEVDDTAVLVRYTRYGDSNLDGTVNLADFNNLAANFGQADRFWNEGDFNYDGVVNLADFNLLAGNFGLSAAGRDGPTPDDWAALASAVPEPAALSILLAPMLLVPRRRRGCRAQ